MKYLVFAVFHDIDAGEVATHSKVMDLGHNSPGDEQEKIIRDIAKSGCGIDSLFEVFVFESAQNYGTAPKQVAHWTDDDIDQYRHDDEEEEEDEEEDPE